MDGGNPETHMLSRLPRSPLLVQSLLLTTVAFILLCLMEGLTVNDVIRNYAEGGHFFLSGLNPYTETLKNGPSNQFKYSPLFALMMAGMVKLGPPKYMIPAWVLTGTLLFSLGLCCWHRFTLKPHFLVAIALFAAVIDLNISLTVNQANAMIAGLILLGLAAYRSNHYALAGAVLMIGTNLKVYPLIFLMALAILFKPKFWIGAIVAGLLAFLLPAAFVGWSHNLHMHMEWVRVVTHDTHSVGTLDLYSSFHRANLSLLGQAIRAVLLIVTVPLFFTYLPLVKQPDWRPFMTFGLASTLLLSPRTEVYTYVLLAPCYVLMTAWCAESQRTGLCYFCGFIVTMLAVAIASCRFANPDWRVSESPHEITRVLGALGFWFISAAILIHQLGEDLRRRIRTVGAET